MTYFLFTHHSMSVSDFNQKCGREYWKVKQQTCSSEIQILALFLWACISSTANLGNEFGNKSFETRSQEKRKIYTSVGGTVIE